MTDAQWNTDAAAPVVPQDSGQDQRFVKAKPERKNPFDFGPGVNHLFILPSCANYKEVLGSGQKYSWGWPYIQIKIRTAADKYGQDLRVQNNNVLTKAYFDLYRAFGWGPKLKNIRENGFNAGPDYRYLFNATIMSPEGRLSPRRFIRAGMKNPYREEKGEAAKPKLREILIQALTEGSDKYFGRNKVRVFPVDLETSVMVALQVQFNGTYPQYTAAVPARDAEDNVIVQNIVSMVPDLKLEQLDEARVWAETLDPLPELSQIPALVEDGEACEVLRINTGAAKTSSSQASVPSSAPVPPRGPSSSPVPPTPVPVSTPVPSAIPRGFGVAPVSPVAQAPVAPSPGPVRPVGPVAASAAPQQARAFSSSSLAAAEDFARQLESEKSAGEGTPKASGAPF